MEEFSIAKGRKVLHMLPLGTELGKFGVEVEVERVSAPLLEEPEVSS